MSLRRYRCYHHQSDEPQPKLNMVGHDNSLTIHVLQTDTKWCKLELLLRMTGLSKASTIGSKVSSQIDV